MCIKTKLKESLYPLYEKLAEIDKKIEYQTFCAQWGEKYKTGGLLFVGRAVNDWQTDCRDTELLFKEDGNEDQIFARPDQMKWVEDKNECSKSQFWRVIKCVSQGVLDKTTDWYDHIAWSDLYKLAPLKSNPSKSLCEKQEPLCYEIFKCELAVLRPKVVIMLCGVDWYDNFLCSVNGDNEPLTLEEREWDGYKIIVYKIGETVFIGTVHPQGKSEKSHIEILSTLIKKYY